VSYAEDTRVSAEQSRNEIERILARYGADAFMYGVDGGQAAIGFRVHERYVRFMVALPDRDEMRTRLFRGRPQRRTDAQADQAVEQEIRRRWRCLALAIKAKLEVVETGIATFEEEFLAHIVLANGATFGSWATAELERVYESGEMPRGIAGLLPPGTGTDT
jgi:hypothetical protein